MKLEKYFAQVELDIDKLLPYLIGHHQFWFSPNGNNGMKRLKDSSYIFYHSHAQNTIKPESKLLIQENLVNAEAAVRRKGFHISSLTVWNKCTSFDPALDKDDKLDDQCVFRVYCNVHWGSFCALAIRMLNIWIKESKSKGKQIPFQFKFPKSSKSALVSCGRIEPFVLYFDPNDKEFAKAALSHIQALPNTWFNEHVPLFTHKIAKGRAIAFDPKDNNSAQKINKRWTGVDDFVSYGQYMSIIIATAIQTGVVNAKQRKKDEIIYLNNLTNVELISVKKAIMQYIKIRVPRDLHISEF